MTALTAADAKAQALSAMEHNDFRTAERLLRPFADETNDIEIVNNLAVALIGQGMVAEARLFMGRAQLREAEGQTSRLVRRNVAALNRITGSRMPGGIEDIGEEDPVILVRTPAGDPIIKANSPLFLAMRMRLYGVMLVAALIAMAAALCAALTGSVFPVLAAAAAVIAYVPIHRALQPPVFMALPEDACIGVAGVTRGEPHAVTVREAA